MKLKQLKEILNGWVNIFKKDDDLETLKNKRKSKCDGCPLNKNNICSKHLTAEVIEDFIYNGETRVKGQIVKGCGCPLKAKQASVDSQCPLNKW